MNSKKEDHNLPMILTPKHCINTNILSSLSYKYEKLNSFGKLGSHNSFIANYSTMSFYFYKNPLAQQSCQKNQLIV